MKENTQCTIVNQIIDFDERIQRNVLRVTSTTPSHGTLITRYSIGKNGESKFIGAQIVRSEIDEMTKEKTTIVY